MRVDSVIALSNMGVDFLVDALTALMCGVLTNIDVGVFTEVNTNVVAGVTTAAGFALLRPLEELCC